jgi:hypothetical protein
MFQPTDISGCWFWLKADDAQLFPENPSLPDRYVSSIDNDGYQSCTFTSNISSIQAIFRPFVLNNHASIKFVDTNGLSTGSIQNIPKTDDITAIYLYKQNFASVGADQQFLFQGPNDVASNTIGVFNSSLQLSNIYFLNFYKYGNFQSATSTSGYLNDWIIRSDIVDNTNKIISFRRNGFPVSSGENLFLPLPDISSPPWNGEGQCSIGGSVGTNNQEIAETIIYDHRISDADIIRVENYLKFKYFIGGVAGTPTFIYGSNVDVSGQYHPLTPLYIDALPSSGTTPLYIAQAYTVSSGTPLYTVGVPVQSSGLSLFTGSFLPTESSGTLYILGNTESPSGITLYTASADSFNSNVFLYTNAAPSSSGSTELFIHGRTIGDGNQTLYIQGLQNLSSNNNTALFIATNTSSSTPGVSGIYNSHSLYTYSAVHADPLNLYVHAETQGGDIGNMPLFIGNYAPTHVSTVDMFIRNSNLLFSGQTKMFIKGLGSLDGGFIKNDNMNLYIERWPAGMATLFMNSSIVPSSAPLYISSANSFNANATMMMSGGQQLMGTGNFPIYVDAGFIRDDNITMYTHGLPSSNNNSILYTNGF